MLSCFGSVTPSQQLVQIGDLVVGNPAEDIRQPSLRINAVAFSIAKYHACLTRHAKYPKAAPSLTN